MDIQLLNEIRDLIKVKQEVSELCYDDAVKANNSVADKYVENRAMNWWWENIKRESVTLYYEDGDGLMLLKKIVGADFKDVFLFVTDDDPEPWTVFQGPFELIVDIISELRFFEYFITNIDFDWLIFDTHHNSLIVVGSFLEKAKTIGGTNNLKS